MPRLSRAAPGRGGLVAALAVLLAAHSGEAASENGYKARLTVVPLTVAMQATIAGMGEATATLSGNKLTVNGTFSGLRSPATEAHIQRGPKGIPGPAILDLMIDRATAGKISGSFDLSPSQLNDLKTEQLYIQIDSERAPDGNLRGWLLP